MTDRETLTAIKDALLTHDQHGDLLPTEHDVLAYIRHVVSVWQGVVR